MIDLILWIVAVALVIAGLAGALLPALPGALLVFIGLVLAAWADGFTNVGGATIAVLAVLTASTYALDFVAGAIGARRFGASRRAMIGASIGAVVGIFFGIWGIILGPFAGAHAEARPGGGRAGRRGGLGRSGGGHAREGRDRGDNDRAVRACLYSVGTAGSAIRPERPTPGSRAGPDLS
jgi:uncharacterized protein YqgC (DUF456 family)